AHLRRVPKLLRPRVADDLQRVEQLPRVLDVLFHARRRGDLPALRAADAPTGEKPAGDHKPAVAGAAARALELPPGVVAREATVAVVVGEVRDARAGHHVAAARSESTRLNSSHVKISYAVFCLKK